MIFKKKSLNTMYIPGISDILTQYIMGIPVYDILTWYIYQVSFVTEINLTTPTN